MLAGPLFMAINSRFGFNTGMKDYYRILEVHPEASTDVVTRAYKTLAKKYHPDRYHISDKRLLTERMQELNEAYETLADPGRRERYNRRYQSYVSDKPALDRQARKRQQIRNILYGFLLAIFLAFLFRGFLAAFLLHPAVRAVVIGLVALLAIRLWKR